VEEWHSVVRLDHVNVTTPVELEDDVLAWYQDVLGLERLEKPDGTRSEGGWFRVGDQQVHVSVDEHNPPQSAHFGLVVEDFDALVTRLRAAGCHIEQARTIPGRHRCFTRDPAGNSIEFMAFDA
jgi:catechol 2,3-dioxygenase-like lactoylglutathione lyase family enzyme